MKAEPVHSRAKGIRKCKSTNTVIASEARQSMPTVREYGSPRFARDDENRYFYNFQLPKPLANRVVIDTNVWLSAALSPAGASSQVVRRVLTSGVPVFSDATFAELEARIWKPKFDRYLSMEARQGILHDARALGHWVGVPPDIATQRFSRDADDDKFIHTALAGTALWLVTGDQDLLVIEADLGMRIVAPAQALLMEDFFP